MAAGRVSTVEVRGKVMVGSGQVQRVAASVLATTVVEEQQLLPQPSSKNQGFMKLRGVFRRQKSTVLVSEQAKCESAKGCCTESLAEPAAGYFIAAVRGPSGVQPQPEMPSSLIASAGKPAVQVRPAVCRPKDMIVGCTALLGECYVHPRRRPGSDYAALCSDLEMRCRVQVRRGVKQKLARFLSVSRQ